MTARWYALHSKPNKEWILLRQLRARGVEVFYPCLSLPSSNSPELEIKSYFPGYLFVKVDFEKTSLSSFKWMAHAEGLVCIDGIPAYVPDNLMEAIKAHIEEFNTATNTLSRKFQAVDVPSDGSPINERQIFASGLSDSQRVKVLLKALNQMKTAPELGDSKLRKIESN